MILEHVQTVAVDLQFITQSTADIAATLYQASYEIFLERRQFIKKSVISNCLFRKRQGEHATDTTLKT